MCCLCGPHCGVQFSVTGFIGGCLEVNWSQRGQHPARLIYPFIIDATDLVAAKSLIVQDNNVRRVEKSVKRSMS